MPVKLLFPAVLFTIKVSVINMIKTIEHICAGRCIGVEFRPSQAGEVVQVETQSYLALRNYYKRELDYFMGLDHTNNKGQFSLQRLGEHFHKPARIYRVTHLPDSLGGCI